ncbi:translocation/assembly module TamB domain-containing protein [Brytella acorum]|uniref:Translocation/assembly module TamB domain-containing protein n=1 Tax=Brytella acorum TaxID=2959299 RepID=A0AA35UNI9_9PROT|nr:translocation/assembly module TamB domain-containing protein [Brytella acorum]MDF3624205.1 translocation/assembly module TamB domain-containing protein [Brytella acorum]CAI9120711.1 translocation/assembly module TamB domain-containing protein [Brytella acorum]
MVDPLVSPPAEKNRPRSTLRRVLRWSVLLGLGVPAGLIGVAVGVLLIGANTSGGRHLIERQTTALTGGMVKIEGLGGRFPDDLHLRRLTLRDDKGLWLELDALHLAWSPLSLVRLDVSASLLSADRLAIPRLPAPSSSPTTTTKSTAPSSLKFGIDVAKIHIGRLEVGAPVAGVAAVFALDGNVHLADLAPVLDGLAVDRLPDAAVAVQLRRLDADGQIRLTAVTPRRAINLHLDARDGAGGFITALAGLETLDPAVLRVDLHGPLHDEVLDFGATAGPANASVTGRLNLLDKSTDLTIRAHAPAMTLRPGVGWNDISLDAKLHGPLSAPMGQGHLLVDALAAAGAGVGRLRASFEGQEAARPGDSTLSLHLAADGVSLPGAQPTLLAGAPLTLDVFFKPDADGRPLQLALNHALAQVTGQVRLQPAPRGALDVILPDLAPLARIGGADVRGHAVLHTVFSLPEKAQDASSLKLTGDLGITGGVKAAVGLIGSDGHLAVDASMIPHGPKDRIVTLKQVALDGATLHFQDSGSVTLGERNSVRTDATLGLTDFSRISPSIKGHSDLTLHAEGPLDDLAASLHLDSVFGAYDVPAGPIVLDAVFSHLPGLATGTIKASGTLDRAKLAIDAALDRNAAGATHVALNAFDWNSVQGKGDLTFPKNGKVPLGNLDLGVKRLADFSALTGQKLGGHLTLAMRTTQPGGQDAPLVRVALDGALQSAMASVSHLQLGGTVANPVDRPDLDLKLDLAGLAARGVTGTLQATAKGPMSDLALTTRGALQNVAGGPAVLDTALRLDLPKKNVRIDRLNASVKGDAVHLLSPAAVDFGTIMGVDHLRATLTPPHGRPATLDLAGTFKPALNVTARFDSLTPALATPFVAGLSASGTLDGQARVTGTLAKPQGQITVRGRDLRMSEGNAAAFPAASIDVSARLQGDTAQLDADMKAGTQVTLAVRGAVPTNSAGRMNVRANGQIDLSVADSILGAQGVSTAGIVAIDVGAQGTLAAPRATGRVELRHASVDDYAQGARLHDINGALVSNGENVTIENLVAHAGAGTIGVSGMIGVFRPGLPVDLHIVADKAQPISSDLLSATIKADLKINGQAASRLDVDGRVIIPTATINIPNSMPASVPQLDVVRPGEKRDVEAASSRVIGLNIDVISPGELFVRGHGLDAEMLGKLHLGGLTSAPAISGGFTLRRGNFNLAGVNLNFTQGRVSFDGSGVTHKLDPTLDFRADRNVEGTLASLNVTGYASAPKIDFTSVPEEPRDQVLAMLLFGTTTAKLSTTQLAELAAAVAQIAGGSSFDPLSKVRNALGLDRLALGGGSGVNNGGASVEAGKYVMKGVYVGAKQATSGSGTQAQVQVDLTRHLKLNTTVGTGGQVTGFTTPENDPGSSVGLSWKIDY